MRKYGKWLLVLGILAASPGLASADGFLNGVRQSLPSKSAVQQRNQLKAQEVAQALQKARVNGYDLTVEVQGEVVKLEGKVRDASHKLLAEKACQQVTGIHRVVNQLKFVATGQVQQATVAKGQALTPAVYEQGEDNAEIQQIRYTKPGKRSQNESQASAANTQKKPSALSRLFSFGRRQQQPQQPTAARPRPASAARARTASRTTSTPAQTVSAAKSAANPAANKTAATPRVAPKAVAAKAAAPAQTEATPVIKQQPVKSVSLPKPAPVPAPVPATLPESFAGLPQPAPVPAALPAPVPAALPAPVPAAQPAGPSNQEVAQQIAGRLAQVGLVGYDVEIRYEDGQATLNGQVATVSQQQNAAAAASQVPGVRNVQNNLKVSGPLAQGNAQQSAIHPVTLSSAPAMMALPHGAAPGQPTAIAGAGNFSNPNLPNHAWPAYAAYPNSAAISYPKQYSASAWPYIGPFYPYPQVPMGWREVRLKWDDGYWQLDFEKKHNAWHWLWRPANWQ